MNIVIFLFGLFLFLLNSYFYFGGFQSKGYEPKDCLFGVTKLIIIDTMTFIIAVVLCLIFKFSNFFDVSVACLITMIPSLVSGVYKAIRYIGLRVTFTHRLIRCYSLYGVIVVFLSLPIWWINDYVYSYGIMVALSGVVAYLTLLIMYPVERRINKRYILDAKTKLSTVKPMVIGVTGSAGKTTVKEILKVLLAPLGKIYATPKSYNTPMGVVRSISTMPSDTDIFIVEYGARHKGDIDCLLDIVPVDVAILTAISPQHLETFGDIGAVFSEKVKLLKASHMSFANEKCKWAGDDFPSNTVFFGESQCISKQCTVDGTVINAIIDGKELTIRSKLLGNVNADNLLLAIGVAIRLGIDIDDIVNALPSVKAVPHRMELIKNDKGITIIDDSFNINPLGSISALDVLKTAKGRKIVTSSGFVEQGNNDKQALNMLIDKVEECADMLIILGNKNKKAMLDIIGKRIPYRIARDMQECIKIYSELLVSGDTLLILADIPTSYEL